MIMIKQMIIRSIYFMFMLFAWITPISAMQIDGKTAIYQAHDPAKADTNLPGQPEDKKLPTRERELTKLTSMWRDCTTFTHEEQSNIELRESKIHQFREDAFKKSRAVREVHFHSACIMGEVVAINAIIEDLYHPNPLGEDKSPTHEDFMNEATMQNYFKHCYYQYNVQVEFNNSTQAATTEAIVKHHCVKPVLASNSIVLKITQLAGESGNSKLLGPLVAGLKISVGVDLEEQLPRSMLAIIKNTREQIATRSSAIVLAKHRNMKSTFDSALLRAYKSSRDDETDIAPATQHMDDNKDADKKAPAIKHIKDGSCCCDNLCCDTCCTLCNCCTCWQNLWKSFKKCCSC